MLQNLMWCAIPLFFICALIRIRRNMDHLQTYEFLYEQNKKIILRPAHASAIELITGQCYYSVNNNLSRPSMKSRLLTELENIT